MYIIGTTVGAGAHRLWSHKSYKANTALKIYLMLGHTLAGHNSAFVWARDHRVHHKFSDTDGDPHNTKRGFFFSHCGWLLRKKHPELRIKASTIEFADLYADPVLTFQRKNYLPLYFMVGFFIPMAIPVLFWGETWFNAFMVTYAWRLVNTLHGTWFVNSAGHMFGDQPYDKKIKPVENWMVSFGSAGEGYHNYHHTFPYDYATSELGYVHNVTKRFIDLMSLIGLASDLRKPSKEAIERQKAKASTHHSIHAFEF
jgi:stearoyl-CoA desaturase (delta-9 desaturase)